MAICPRFCRKTEIQVKGRKSKVYLDMLLPKYLTSLPKDIPAIPRGRRDDVGRGFSLTLPTTLPAPALHHRSLREDAVRTCACGTGAGRTVYRTCPVFFGRYR
jgi:hypothetical protein